MGGFVVGVPLVVQRVERHMRSLELAECVGVDSEERVWGKRGCPRAERRLRNSLDMLLERLGGKYGSGRPR